MQSKGSAMAFFFVLLVMCVGAFAAFSALTSGRESPGVAIESGTPMEVTGTVPVGSSPVPTDTPAETPSPGSELSTPVAPTATPVPPFTPTPPPSPTPSVSPTATETNTGPGPAPPSGSHQYRVARNEQDCNKGGIIGGSVYDAGGNGLAWANLWLYTEGWDGTSQSEGPPRTGKYEFTIFGAGLFHLVILDDDGQPVSPVIDVDFDPSCSQRVDWERVQ